MDKKRLELKVLPQTLEKIDRLRKKKQQPRGVYIDDVIEKIREPRNEQVQE